MKVKDALESLAYGVEYKLIGAKTGKTLARSWRNKISFIEKYYGCESRGIYPGIRTIDNYANEIYYPIICIWVSGE